MPWISGARWFVVEQRLTSLEDRLNLLHDNAKITDAVVDEMINVDLVEMGDRVMALEDAKPARTRKRTAEKRIHELVAKAKGAKR